MHGRLLVVGTTLALVGGGAGAATAQDTAPPTTTEPAIARSAAVPPGTIVFLKGYDVWLAHGDGRGQYRVTFDGTRTSPYRSPSMSDVGTIAVGRGTKIVRMKQNGTVLNRIDPEPIRNSAGDPVDGPPVDVAISPDGTKIAYTMVTYSCPIGTDCLARPVTGITKATGFTAPGGLGRSYYADPSWVGNGRTMQHGGYLSQMMLQDVGGSTGHWFDDGDIVGDLDSTDLGDGEVSRDGKKLVAVRGYGADRHLVWFTVNGNVFTSSPASLPNPTYVCASSNDRGIAEPTWAPDGSAFAFGSSEGLYVTGNVGSCDGSTWTLVDPAGSAPAWSKAALDPGLREFTLVTRPSINGRARVGVELRAVPGQWSPSPAKFRFRWLRNGNPIRNATTRRYTVRRIDRGKRLAVRVTAIRAGYRSRAAKSRAKLVR